MDTPLVSAIVSTYNSERFIRGCLIDLESQTIAKRLEIIVIDSGSQQNEGAIVKEFQQRYDNIIYIRTEERESLYAAWNRGIKASRGKYITNANTDDRHHRRALERLVDTLEKHPECVLAYADVKVTKQENAKYFSRGIHGYLKNPEFDQRLLFRGCYIGPQPLWRKDLHERYGYFDSSFLSAGDYEFWLRIVKFERFIHVPKILGLYLYNPHGLGAKSINIEETEKARISHWPQAWGPLPEPGGCFFSKKVGIISKIKAELRSIDILYKAYQKLAKQ
jgi:glycosyltransferase involved in cell wall biosynthesis